MTLYVDLCALYHEQGYEVVAGVPQVFSLHPSTEYAWLFHDGKPLTHHLGISPNELSLLESLCEHLSPQRVFAIGNSFGWSTLALALLNPRSTVVALEVGMDKFTDEWIERTNRMAAAASLNAVVVRGHSPEDVAMVVRETLDDAIDLAFIDGEHSPQQIEDDFQAILPFGTPDTVYVFHDIVGFGLWQQLSTISEHAGMTMEVLLGTTSGVGLLLPDSVAPALRTCCTAYGATSEAAALLDYFRDRDYLSIEEMILGVERCVADFHRPTSPTGAEPDRRR